MSSTARMDQTRIDDRIDASARVGDGPSSPTRSPLHLASLSSESLGSPYADGSPNTAAAGLGISLRDWVRDEFRWEKLKKVPQMAMGRVQRKLNF